MNNTLKKVLDDRNINITLLSKETGISRSTLTPIVKNKYLSPKTKVDTLLRISEYLELPISSFINFDDVSFKLVDTLSYQSRLPKLIDSQNNEFKPFDVIYLKIQIIQNEHSRTNYLSTQINYGYPEELENQKRAYSVKAVKEGNPFDPDTTNRKIAEFNNRLEIKYSDNLIVKSIDIYPVTKSDIDLLNKNKIESKKFFNFNDNESLLFEFDNKVLFTKLINDFCSNLFDNDKISNIIPVNLNLFDFNGKSIKYEFDFLTVKNIVTTRNGFDYQSPTSNLFAR